MQTESKQNWTTHSAVNTPEKMLSEWSWTGGALRALISAFYTLDV